jgi:hypothetical protein
MSREARSESPFVDFAAGSTILHGGEAAGALFIIEAGKVAIERPAAPGVALVELGPGEVFGEAAVLQDAMHATNAVARTAVRALRIDSASLHAVLRENVEVAVHLLRRLALRLRASDERQSTAVEPGRPSASPRADADAPVAAAKAAHVAPPDAARPPPSAVAPAPVEASAVPAAVPMPKPASAPAASAPALAAVPVPASAPAPVQAAPPAPIRVQAHVLRHAQGSIPLPEGKADCLVGRPDPATGAIPEINLGPLDLARSLSRRHARLAVTADGVDLREEPGVANGTWVNGERVPAGKAIRLKRGDKLRFGAIELEFDHA